MRNLIAFASRVFKAGSVQNRDVSMRVFDEAGLLQRCGGNSNDANLTCYNARGDAARIVLVPGRHVHIDLIVRAAQTTTWIPNDTRAPLDCFGACDGKTGTFVESPLIVGFSLEPSDVRIIPPTTITRPDVFHGQCIRGYIVLSGPQQLRDILTVSPVELSTALLHARHLLRGTFKNFNVSLSVGISSVVRTEARTRSYKGSF